MALSARQQIQWWGVFAVIFILIFWFLGDVLLPFVVGSALAYLLDPLADRLEKIGCSRLVATAIITVVALTGIISAFALLIPLLVRQLAELAATAPEIAASLMQFLQERFPYLIDTDSPVQVFLASLGEIVKRYDEEVISAVFSSAKSALNGLLFIVVVPVVLAYMLADWDRAIQKVDSWLPRDHAEWIRELAREIDKVIAGFVRGQLMVCAILATFYACLLLLVGLRFGLFVGCIAGFISFIPFVGAIAGGALAVGLALFQFWSEPVLIGAVFLIFVAGQLFEGNFLTPKLVGKLVGLHPVWLLFAFSAFGALFGFVGLLIAVPVAAAMGVVLRFGVAQYLEGSLYRGASRGNGQ